MDGSGDTVANKDQFVMAIDVGTSSVRCHIYNRETAIVGQAAEKVELVYPNHGWSEIEPDALWEATLAVCRNAIKNANLSSSDITSMGISAQRNTFTIWNKVTGKHYHNFITWKDLRTEELCNEWNRSYRVAAIRAFGGVMHRLTRKKKFLAARIFKFTPAMVIVRLLWSLDTFKNIREDTQRGEALYGTIDTFLIWKLTGGQVHATDPSNACVSGFYDPFELKWASWATSLFDLPPKLFPEVKDTNAHFGDTIPELFGVAIPIRCAVGDQQGAMFGEACFEAGDIKITLGTGSFVNMNTGLRPHASFKGIYPVVGWKLENEEKAVYLAEGSSADTGTTIDWASSIGLFEEPSKSSQVAKEAGNSNCFFVPAFSGLQAPYNDPSAVAAFLNIEPTTTRAQMTKAVLESVAFRIKQKFAIVAEEVDFTIGSLRIDGGVSSNEFVVQLIADLLMQQVASDGHREMSSLGAATLAGLASGAWKDKDELRAIRQSKPNQVYTPNVENCAKYEVIYKNWLQAVKRCLTVDR